MTRIELTPEEAESLHEILESFLSDLRVEVIETDDRDYRIMLKRREAFVKKLLRALEYKDVTIAM